MKKHGKLDILNNNAGITPEYPQGVLSFEQLSLELLTQIYQTNVRGSLGCFLSNLVEFSTRLNALKHL